MTETIVYGSIMVGDYVLGLGLVTEFDYVDEYSDLVRVDFLYSVTIGGELFLLTRFIVIDNSSICEVNTPLAELPLR